MTEENETVSQNSTDADSDEETETWWQTMLGGVALLGFAGFLWWYFTDFENSTDTTRRMHAIFAILYNLGGKQLVCGLVTLIAVGTIGLGGWQFANRNK